MQKFRSSCRWRLRDRKLGQTFPLFLPAGGPNWLQNSSAEAVEDVVEDVVEDEPEDRVEEASEEREHFLERDMLSP